MHLDEAQQLDQTYRFVERALNRPPDSIIKSPSCVAYRARVTMRPDDHGVVGYFRPKTHQHVPITHCSIARPEINAILKVLPPLPKGVVEIELRSNGTSVVVVMRTRRRHGPSKGQRGRGTLTKQHLSRFTDIDLAGIVVDDQTIYGDPVTRLNVSGITHELGPSTFYQVNLEVNELLVSTVKTIITDLSPSRVLDLYSGAGNLSLPLAHDGISTVMMEQSNAATRDARRTLKRMGLDQSVQVITGDAGAFQAGDAFFDVAILDPPRAGAPGVISQLIMTRPKAILYISCNPAALARDIRPARASGYTITQLQVYQMFPQTPHTEVLCLLTR